jgi:hypothetical protein
VGELDFKTPFHNESMGKIAMDGATSGDYRYMTVQRNLRTTVGRLPGLTNDDIPDVAGVRRDGRVDLWEVPSQGQRRPEMVAKLEAILKTLPPERRGQIYVIDPVDPSAHYEKYGARKPDPSTRQRRGGVLQGKC